MPKKASKKKAARAVKSVVKPIAAPMQTADAVKKSKTSVRIYWLVILFFVAATFYILGRGQEIIKHFDANKNMPTMSSELLDSAKEKLISGDTKGVIADMTVALEHDPNLAMAYTIRGEAFMAEANYSDAMTDLNRATQLDSQSALAVYDRALLNIQLENFGPAMTDLNTALSLVGNDKSGVLTERAVYSKRAQLNLWLKNWDAAVADYTAAINLSGEVPADEDLAGRADALTALGQYQQAVNDYMAAVTMISTVIKDEPDAAKKINMSRRALSYFEKSAALHVQLNEMDNARNDLEAANTLATALKDEDSQKRIAGLLASLPATTPAPTPTEPQPAPAQPEPAPAAPQVVE